VNKTNPKIMKNKSNNMRNNKNNKQTMKILDKKEPLNHHHFKNNILDNAPKFKISLPQTTNYNHKINSMKMHINKTSKTKTNLHHQKQVKFATKHNSYGKHMIFYFLVVS
jgi:hypothetical protein